LAGELFETIHRMSDIMYVSQGIGLAAPQVGIGLSIFLVDAGDGLKVFINPQILESSARKSRMEEGCLSLPGIQVSVARPEEVKVRARDAKGEYFIEKFDGIKAKAVQHENDHLEGKLIIDYFDPIRRFIAVHRLNRHKSNTKEDTCEVICNVGKDHK